MNTIGWAIVYVAITWECRGRANEMDKETRQIAGGLLVSVLFMMFLAIVRDLFR